jgi:ribose transport system permease protein
MMTRSQLTSKAANLFSVQTRYILVIYALSIVLIPLSKLASPSLGSWSEVSAVLVVASLLTLVGFCQGLVILIGELDLSIAPVLAFSGVLTTAWLGVTHSALTVAAIFGILCAIGVINGVGVAFLKVPSFIMTLGTQLVMAGIGLWYTKGTVPGSTPPLLASVMGGRVGGLPVPILILIAVAIGGTVVQQYTGFGRRLYAIGSNRRTAGVAGVRVGLMIVLAFVISALCAGMTGMLLVGYAGGATLAMGDPYFLPSIAVVVVGGSSIMGGRGSYIGTVGAAIFLTTISTIIQALGINQGWQVFIYGVMILGVLALLRKDIYTYIVRAAGCGGWLRSRRERPASVGGTPRV